MKVIEEPTECPCCSYPLEKINDQLFCRNVACSAQIAKKLEHFTKTLGIKGLGPKTLQKLNIQEITELFYLNPEELKILVGEKIAIKLLAEIESAKNSTFDVVLSAFSIPLVGKVASQKLASVVTNFSQINKEVCKQAGLGDKATDNLLTWLNTEYKELEEFLPFTFSSGIKTNKNQKTVCITGKLKNYKTKGEVAQMLESAGYTLVDSVTKDTNILVDEHNSNSSKRDKAEKYGIPIINDIETLLNTKESIL